VQVIGLPAPNLHKELDAFKTDYEVILIDGGGRITAAARVACAVADFIIVPTRPSKPDLLSTKEFLRTVIEEIRAMRPVAGGILITQMQAGTVVGKAAREEIHTLGYPVFDTIVHTRVAYQEAMAAGMSVLEYASDSKAAQETRALFDEVREAIA
jgi:chromosome partitioning protein